MTTYLVFLRGINVGGHKKFPKAAQEAILNELCFHNPKVYLHTGNWVFQSSESKEVLEEKLLKAIELKQGWQVPVLIKTISEVETILNRCPFPEAEKLKSYFMLLYQNPSKEKVAAVHALHFEAEKFEITASCIYFYSAVGYGKSKLSNNFFEHKLKAIATTRNYNTMVKVLELAK